VSDTVTSYISRRSPLLKVWRVIRRPRGARFPALNVLQRMDHIHALLADFRDRCSGELCILGLGAADGYSFIKMLYAARYLGMEERVTVHAFDSARGTQPGAAQSQAQFDHLRGYCAAKYPNFRIHQGRFEQTMTPAVLDRLRASRPVLVCLGCDGYAAVKSAMQRLIPYLSHGCVLYFDECDSRRYGSRISDEARLVREVNRGLFGSDIELVLDRKLGLGSGRLYRFLRSGSRLGHAPLP
jgi:hypothetical protein